MRQRADIMSNGSDVRRLRPGDLVEVRSPEEILRTLDADGTVDHLPFMPEMVEFCGKRFRVSRRVVKTCFSGSISTMLAFDSDDVVTLEGLRCSGAAHDDCQKACMIFWREAWLRRVEQSDATRRVDGDGHGRLQDRLKTSTGPNTYFCQASELLKAARPLSHRERLRKSVSEVLAGNCTAFQMAQRLGVWVVWKIRLRVRGQLVRGRTKSTPVERLNLMAGESIEVKPIESIVDTLNDAGRHRGLSFSPGMRLSCGRQHRVKTRLDRIIVDGTGEMRHLKNTVALEGSLCGCAHIAFGGCSRCEFNYWREIWLCRSPASSKDTGAHVDS
jgi:hypothetical protein